MESIQVGIQFQKIVHAGIAGIAKVEHQHIAAALEQAPQYLRLIQLIAEHEVRGSVTQEWVRLRWDARGGGAPKLLEPVRVLLGASIVGYELGQQVEVNRACVMLVGQPRGG